jgi:HSP20 family molecular chaperone IbpA
MFTTPETEHERFVPMISLHETPAAYEIELALPTATLEDVDVKPHRHGIAIRCRRAIDHDEAAKLPRFGTFVKVIRLGCPIDSGSVAPDLRAGLLRIRAQKLRA